jgi:glucose/arabinose dehydrogenase
MAGLNAAGCSPAESAPDPQARAAEVGPDRIPSIRMVPTFGRARFERPVCMTQPPGDDRFFVVEQEGRIQVLQSGGAGSPTLFLDISPKVRSYKGHHNEEGLLALAFHPKYATNGWFFVHYTASDPMRGVISRFKVSADENRADPKSEAVILEVPKPFGNHNGCCLLFGPDGYLYATFGDGGHAGDPYDNGQKLDTLLGKVIRIDIDGGGPGRRYAIPRDNPFEGRGGARGEVWAYGLRNVWRMSFDRKTGQLWGGDVGQDAWEEVDIIEKGGNYGWALREGNHEFKGGKAKDPLIDPVAEYDRWAGLSITGGYVYRGQRFPAMQGVYLYADYITGTIWGLRFEEETLIGPRIVLRQPKNIASFAEDHDGELYALCFDSQIYRIEQVD